ncbi:uncharacterized protein KQ657_003888 [Scheffersomyces spartinae]|uniref:Prefoldin subunit 2 n=1 Tax=Scheffersomyces spartinae TaxID=45513 RepID=A0A9P8AJZ8_9ASCO|nr:uncharacterized protein KQ657_003888 [Scheffersomyces spartinae]KAG7195360.1 hypothetical protein KQ657_003888 [Scheffersomyces spartinae]
MVTKEEALQQHEKLKKVQGLQVTYNRYQETATELQNQLNTIASQILEHEIVQTTLGELPESSREGRKCFKMIGGVLVDKTVDEVLKMLKEELGDLRKERAKLDTNIKELKKEMDAWIKKNHIQVVRQ